MINHRLFQYSPYVKVKFFLLIYFLYIFGSILSPLSTVKKTLNTYFVHSRANLSRMFNWHLSKLTTIRALIDQRIKKNRILIEEEKLDYINKIIHIIHYQKIHWIFETIIQNKQPPSEFWYFVFCSIFHWRISIHFQSQ